MPNDPVPADHDPRDRITPESLNVAPELLGLPLARPMRRLLAIGIDIALLAALSNFGNFWLIAGLAVLALVHLRDPLAGSHVPQRRWFLWAVAAALLAFGAQQAWVTGRLVHHKAHGVQDEDADDAIEAAADAVADQAGGNRTTKGAARRAAREAARAQARAEANDAKPTDGAKPTDEAKAVDRAASAALATRAAQAGSGASTASSASPASAPSAASAVPGPTPLQVAQTRIAVLQAQLAEARSPKPFNLGDRVMSWADDVGLGLGWAILYFALLPVRWNGQTIGKRLLGLRVVELTGKPMTAMRAFKRYGGYAAGVATGMFGFAQVFWDPNRQAIQDKTAHTVVIDLRRKLPDPRVTASTPPPSTSSPTEETR